VAQNLNDMGGDLLLHLLLFDLTRLTDSAYRSGDLDLAGRILIAVARGLQDDDEYVSEAVAVSFVEDFAVSPDEIDDDLLVLWPKVLRDELGR
jgi:hypothetical protein